MRKSQELLQKFLESALAPHGAIVDLCKRSGLSRSAVETWRDGARSPNLENLDRIAAALGVQPWEVIKPESAEPTQAPTSLGDVLLSQLSPAKRRLIELALKADDAAVEIAMISLEAAASAEAFITPTVAKRSRE